MNLFIVGWNCPRPLTLVALAELHQVAKIYPQLDPQTTCFFEASNEAFSASISTANEVAKPRCYVSKTQDEMVFYSGFLIDRNDKFKAYDAQYLRNHWNELPNSLEGRFVVIKLTKEPRIELFNDFIGIEQVYYFCSQSMWLLSNSVSLISKICKFNKLDTLGTSLFLAMDWVGSDRTLIESIKVLHGGQHWTWSKSSSSPRKTSYFQLYDFCHKASLSLNEDVVEKIAVEMLAICRTLAENFGKLFCPLTGGHDSRVLASLLIHSGTPAKYFTSGEPSSADVNIAKQITEVFNLPHTVGLRLTKDIVQDWEDSCSRLIRQNDGMISLWQIADVYRQPLHIKERSVFLSGVGGEIGRGFYSNLKLFNEIHDLKELIQLLNPMILKNPNGLIYPEVVVLAQAYLEEFISKAYNEGFALADIPDFFYINERVRGWVGINSRKAIPVSDSFYPFCTHIFVEASFRISALNRYLELLPYKLIQYLEPSLHDLPYCKAWRDQNVSVEIFQTCTTPQLIGVNSAFNQAAWLEAKLPYLRQMCLDQISSPIWDYVNRYRFEQIMLATTPKKRYQSIRLLYAIISLFYYKNNSN